MSPEGRVARAFGLDGDEAWRRHANPWSVYTRIPIPLLLVLAIWSRVWIDWWCLVPVGILVLWMLINPGVFPAPRSLDHWASRTVLGEQLWGRRSKSPVPERHRAVPVVLGVISAAGVPFLVWGLVVLDPWITAFGLSLQMGGKMWFLDRMALLYGDVSSAGAGVRSRNGR